MYFVVDAEKPFLGGPSVSPLECDYINASFIRVCMSLFITIIVYSALILGVAILDSGLCNALIRQLLNMLFYITYRDTDRLISLWLQNGH